ncbi:MAG: hypothetical protein ACLP4R_29560 [Solirubrobacteraceae bacterium]
MSAVALHIAIAPALPLHAAGKYVAGAYIVFVAILLIYVGIMATRLGRMERELDELRRDVLAQERDPAHPTADEPDGSDLERETVA